jgi:hypothetical protein
MCPCGSHRRLEVGLRGGDADDGFCHGTQVADVFGRRRLGVELIEPCLGLGGGLLKLFTGTRHGHHPSEKVACGVKDVFVGDAVLPGTVGDLHP